MLTNKKHLSATVTAGLATSAASLSGAIVYTDANDLTVNFSFSATRYIYFDITGQNGPVFSTATFSGWNFGVGFNNPLALSLYPTRSNNYYNRFLQTTSPRYTARLAENTSIGYIDSPPPGNYAWYQAVVPMAVANAGAPWQSYNNGVITGYLAMELSIAGQPHYGWAHLTYFYDNDELTNTYVTLHGFAFENTANTAISAGAIPEPSSFLLLALGAGAAGLMAHRRKKQSAAKEAEAPPVS